MTTKLFLQVPNYYAFGATEVDCWANLRRISGRTKAQASVNTFFILEFPYGTEIKVDDVTGNWWASHKPIGLVNSNLEEDTRLRYRIMCKQGRKEHAQRVAVQEEAYRRASRGS